MTIILIFGLAFLIPLILILLFLKWRYIWGISFLITIFVIYQLYSIRTYGDGVGQAFAEMFIWLIAGGLLFGIIMKSFLSLITKDTHVVRTNIIIGLSIVLVSVIIGSVIYEKWDDRSPEKEYMPNVLVKYTISASSVDEINELAKVTKTMDEGVHLIINELSKP